MQLDNNYFFCSKMTKKSWQKKTSNNVFCNCRLKCTFFFEFQYSNTYLGKENNRHFILCKPSVSLETVFLVYVHFWRWKIWKFSFLVEIRDSLKVHWNCVTDLLSTVVTTSGVSTEKKYPPFLKEKWFRFSRMIDSLLFCVASLIIDSLLFHKKMFLL